jgi:hypothetical protein
MGGVLVKSVIWENQCGHLANWPLPSQREHLKNTHLVPFPSHSQQVSGPRSVPHVLHLPESVLASCITIHYPPRFRSFSRLLYLLLSLNHSVPLLLQPSVRLLWSYTWWQPRIIRLGWRNPKFIYMGKNVWANGQLTRASADGAFEECQPGSLSVAFPAGFKAKVRSANYTLFRISHCILLKME